MERNEFDRSSESYSASIFLPSLIHFRFFFSPTALARISLASRPRGSKVSPIPGSLMGRLAREALSRRGLVQKWGCASDVARGGGASRWGREGGQRWRPASDFVLHFANSR